MMKIAKLALLCSVLTGCAGIKNVDQIKDSNSEVASEAAAKMKKANAKFFFNEFNDEYEGDKKIKKLGIAYFQIGWDSGSDWRNKSRFMNVSDATPEYQAVVDAAYKKMVEKFQKLGYEVISPSELAEKSATFSSIKPSGIFEYSPTSGQNLTGVSLKDSRYIHAITNEGKLISKINSEAGIDAIVGLYFNDLGTGSGESKLNDNFVLVVNNHVTSNLTICVSREKAKAAGVSLGLFGDANHCGQAVGEFDGKYFLPDMRHSDRKDFELLKRVGFEGISAAYSAAAPALVEALYEEGMED